MKTILTLLFGLSTLITSAQGITKEYLIGRWEQDNKTGFIMYFSIDATGELNCKIISAATGGDIKVLKAKIEEGEFYLNTVNERNDWYALNKHTLIDKNTMEVVVKNEYGVYKLIYKRKKLWT